MSNNAKLLRGQVRQAVKEILGEVLSQELVASLETRLQERLKARMDGLSEGMKQVLDSVDARSKEVQSYLVRATTQHILQPSEPIEPPKASE